MRVAFQRGDRTPHLGAYRERARRPGRSRRIVESMFFDFSEDALRPAFIAVEVHHPLVNRVAVGGSWREVVLVVPPLLLLVRSLGPDPQYHFFSSAFGRLTVDSSGQLPT